MFVILVPDVVGRSCNRPLVVVPRGTNGQTVAGRRNTRTEPEKDCFHYGNTDVEEGARLRADRYMAQEHAPQGHRDQGICPRY